MTSHSNDNGEEQDKNKAQQRYILIIGPDEVYDDEFYLPLEEALVEMEKIGFITMSPRSMMEDIKEDAEQLMGQPGKLFRNTPVCVMLTEVKFMLMCMALADCIYLLPGWNKSNLSVLLAHFAFYFRVPILAKDKEEFCYVACFPIMGVGIGTMKHFESSESIFELKPQDANNQEAEDPDAGLKRKEQINDAIQKMFHQVEADRGANETADEIEEGDEWKHSSEETAEPEKKSQEQPEDEKLSKWFNRSFGIEPKENRDG